MKKGPIVTALLLLLIGVAACSQTNNETATPLKVERGDLMITVSGSGAIEISSDATLTFGTSGRIEKLLVKEGDEVTAGQVLAQLETDALALSLAQAKVAQAQAQFSANQSALAVTQAEVAVTQAEIGLKSAQIALEQTIKTTTVEDIRVAQAELDTAKSNLSDSLVRLSLFDPGSTGYSEYQKNVVLAQARVQAAQSKMDAMLSGFSSDEVAVKQQQVTAAQQSLNAARQSLELSKLSAEIAQQSLELAALSRDYAQKQLDKATLIAPFAGLVDRLPVDEGDTVGTATPIAHLIEPEKMELRVQVDEIDIPGIKKGQRAIIKIDALPEMKINGTVVSIGLVPRKEAGVTLFEVKIAFDAGEIGVRSGMSASADIVTVERKNTLLVPSRVIKQNADGKDVVEVTANGQTIEKTVVTGISDGFQTEIVNGLKEGEILVDGRAK